MYSREWMAKMRRKARKQAKKGMATTKGQEKKAQKGKEFITTSARPSCQKRFVA
jgi:hypothetical protein